MTALQKAREVQPPPLSAAEAEMAQAAQRCIMEALDRSRAASITLTTTAGVQEPIQLPPAALKLIGQILGLMSEQKAFALIPSKQEMSTVEAANFLNVSRPFVIKEIEAKRLAHRMVGSHRRIAFEDLLAYAREMRHGQEAALERLADDARELGLDY